MVTLAGLETSAPLQDMKVPTAALPPQAMKTDTLVDAGDHVELEVLRYSNLHIENPAQNRASISSEED